MMTYATVEAILAGMFGAEGNAQEKAFRGRLKHFKRLGVPLGYNPGKGAKNEYTADYLAQMAFCLELAEFGLDPTAIVSFVKANWTAMIYPELLEAHKPGSGTIYFAAYPNLMSATWAGTPQFTFEWLESQQIEDRSRYLWTNHRRGLLINASALMGQLTERRENIVGLAEKMEGHSNG